MEGRGLEGCQWGDVEERQGVRCGGGALGRRRRVAEGKLVRRGSGECGIGWRGSAEEGRRIGKERVFHAR